MGGINYTDPLSTVIALFGNFFFWIGNKTFIERTEHHAHDGEHSEQEIKYK